MKLSASSTHGRKMMTITIKYDHCHGFQIRLRVPLISNPKMVIMKTSVPKQTPVKLLTEEFWSKNEILNQPGKIEHSVNIIDKNGNYRIQVNAPGFKKEDFRIRVENGILNIQAYATDEKEEIKKNYVRKEFLTSSLARSFRLPEGIDVSDIKARYKSGRLYIKMGKANTVKKMNKKIKVQ